MRETDMMSHWGAPEFAFSLPCLDPVRERDVIDRIRLELAGRLSTSDLLGSTAGFGIVDAVTCA